MNEAVAQISNADVMTFAFYKCEGKFCGNKYAVQEKATEEPYCSVCGSYYFSHIADKRIKLVQGG